MKKKLLSLMLAIMMLAIMMLVSTLMLTSCENVTAFQLVSDALVKTNSLDSIDAVIDMKTKVDMTMAGETTTQEMPVELEIKASGIQSDALKMLLSTSMEMEGQKMSVDVYQEGEWFYMEMFGMGVKMKAGEMTEEYDGMKQLEDLCKEIPEALLADVEVVKNDDGTKTVSAAIPDDQMHLLFPELIDDMTESIAGGEFEFELVNFTVTDGKIAVKVTEDGYVSSYQVAYKMSFTMNLGAEMEALGMGSIDVVSEIDGTVTYNNPGADVVVTPMKGYESFMEISAEDMGL